MCTTDSWVEYEVFATAMQAGYCGKPLNAGERYTFYRVRDKEQADSLAAYLSGFPFLSAPVILKKSHTLTTENVT